MKVTVYDVLNPEAKRECPRTGRWVACRPLSHRHESFFERLRNAVGVVRGKYDVLEWEE